MSIEHIKSAILEDEGITATHLDALHKELVWSPPIFGSLNSHRDVCRVGVDELSRFPHLECLVAQCMSVHPSTADARVLGVFCNYYKDGSDYTPFHQDTYGCDVLTLSLGGARDFLTKPTGTGTGTKSTKYVCENGDIILFTQGGGTAAHGVRDAVEQTPQTLRSQTLKGRAPYQCRHFLYMTENSFFISL